MRLLPISLLDANKFVVRLHRHHDKVQGHKFSIGCHTGENLLGVAIVGRPVSRYLDNGLTLEVTRLCTDGSKNVCSFLYSACARVAENLGYDKIQTYILDSESGTSLKSAGWILEEANCGSMGWTGHKESGGRTSEVQTLFGTIKKYPSCKKQRWVKYLSRSPRPNYPLISL